MMKTPTLLSAEKSVWYGGVEGVGGAYLKLVLKSEKDVIFDYLQFKENDKLPIAQKKENRTYYLSSDWRAPYAGEMYREDEKVIQTTPQLRKIGDKAKLYYHYKDSSTAYFINVEFTNKSISTGEQMYP